MKKILLLLAILLLSAGLAQAQDANTISSNGKICAAFFYIPGCSHCAAAEEHFKALEAKYPSLEIKSINADENLELLYKLYEKFSVPQYNAGYLVWGKVPVLFIGSEYFIGDTPIIDNFETEIQKHAEIGVACPAEMPASAENSGNTAPAQGFLPLGTAQIAIIIALAAIIAILAFFMVKKGKKPQQSEASEKKASQEKEELPLEKEAAKETEKKPKKKKKRK